VQVGDYIKFAVDTLKSGAQVIKSITDVARAWGRYYHEKAEAAALAEELRRARESSETADRNAEALNDEIDKGNNNLAFNKSDKRRLKKEAEEAEARALELAMDAETASGGEAEYNRAAAAAAAAAEEAERKRALYETRKPELEAAVAREEEIMRKNREMMTLMVSARLGTEGFIEAVENSYPAEVIDCYRALVKFNAVKWDMGYDFDGLNPDYQAAARKLVAVYRDTINNPGVSQEFKDKLKGLIGVSSQNTIEDINWLPE
jgi:hypothetical protein